MRNTIERAKIWARHIKTDVVALYLAGRDSRTPWHAKVVALCIAAYAISPIDLIPDFVPVLGYLDDLIILPLGILLAVRLIPADLMAEFRRAAAEQKRLPTQKAVAIAIVAIWIAVFLALGWWAIGQFGTVSSVSHFASIPARAST
jgi:uncharacterized membrane protein YkvA (DUF1232 family)